MLFTYLKFWINEVQNFPILNIRAASKIIIDIMSLCISLAMTYT